MVGMGELVDQTRLSHSRLSYQRHHLSTACLSLRQDIAEDGHLHLSSNKPRQPARRGGLYALLGATCSKQLEDFYGLGQSFDWHRSQSIDLDQTLHQA